MPFIKSVWNFSGNPSGRWSEILHWESDSFSIVRDACVALVPKRLAMLHPTCSLGKIQLTKLNALRESFPIPVNQSGSISGAAAGPANLAEAAVITLGSLDPPASRKLWMGGLDELALVRQADTGQTLVGPNYLAALNEWLDEITTNTAHCCVLKRHPGGSVLAPLHSVGEVKPSVLLGATNADIVVSPGMDIEVGETVVFRKVNKKSLPGLEGEFTVLAETGNSITVRYKTPDLRTVITGGGEVYKLDYVEGCDLDMQACGFSYLGSRQRKNEDTGSRGSRSAVKIRGL